MEFDGRPEELRISAPCRNPGFLPADPTTVANYVRVHDMQHQAVAMEETADELQLDAIAAVVRAGEARQRVVGLRRAVLDVTQII